METTNAGTVINDGIEYNEFPPPKSLIKVMKRKWASSLIKNGILRIQNIEYFKKWENEILGDPDDSEGLYHLENHPIQTNSGNDVYAWCLAFPEISSERINLIAKESEYDCIIILHNPELLFSKIREWFLDFFPGYWFQCGAVKYDRGENIDKESLNSKIFHYNVFQKDTAFRDDKEYRLSIVNTTFSRLTENYIDLSLGDFSDLISIEALPNKAFNADG